MSNNLAKFQQVLSAYRKVRSNLPYQLGAIAVRFFKRNFERQGFLNNGKVDKWEQRKRKERGRNRGLLTKSGTLKRGIKIKSTTSNRVVTGVDDAIKYANIHNDGGTIKITRKMKHFFWYMYFKTKDEFWKNLALKKGDITIPQRKFIGESTDLEKEIDEFIISKLKTVFK